MNFHSTAAKNASHKIEDTNAGHGVWVTGAWHLSEAQVKEAYLDGYDLGDSDLTIDQVFGMVTVTAIKIDAADAAAQWESEMLDPVTNPESASTNWTKFEVGETHEAGCQAVGVASERARLNALFDAAGCEAGLVAYLNAR